jgi:hypothetical protein
LPAAGFRNTTSGTLNNRGNAGYYWSSTESGTNAFFLFFSSSTVGPANNLNRANGISLRCIAE